MKKKNLILMSTALLFPTLLNLVACKDNNKVSVPDVISGKDTLITEIKDEPNRVDAKTAIFASLGKLSQASTYKKNSISKIESNKGVINYTQNATCEMIKNNDEYYVDSISKSAFVNMEHEAFYKNNKVAYRNEKGEIKNTTYTNYLNVYGVTPEKLLSGQIFNQDTILFAKLDNYTSNEFTYTIVLDKNKSNELLKYQIKEFGGLNSYPSFVDNTEFTLKINGDYTPISYSYSTIYKISIQVLGDLICTETTNAMFTDFNKGVNIVDSVSFNKAINENPTTITPSVNDESNKNFEAIFKALLNYNLKQGIAIAGDVTIKDNVSIPLRINGRINMDKILSKDLSKAFDLTLKLANNLTITYHENNLYVNCLNNKYAFALTSLNTEIPSIKDININDFITINKDTDVEGLYEIKLADSINSLLFEALNGSGIIKIDKKEDLDISILLYIYNNQINSLKAKVNVNDTNYLSTDFIIGNDIYVLEDLSSYKNEIIKRFNVNVAFSSLEEILNGSITLAYDTLNANPLAALTLQMDIRLTDNVKGLLSMASAFSSDIPEWLNPLSSSDIISILLKNGKLYALSMKDNNTTFFNELKNLNTLTTNQSLDLGISITDILPSLPYLFDVSFIQGNLSIKLNESLLPLINSDFLLGGISEKLLDSFGLQGTLINTILGLYKPLSNIRIDIPLLSDDSSLFTFVVEVYELEATDVFNEALAYDVTNLLKIEATSNDATDYTFSYDLNKLQENEKIAKKIREKIANLKNSFALTDEYLTEVNNLKSEYESLSDDVKLLVYNSSVKSFFSSTFVGDYLIKQYNTEIKEVDKFATDCVNESKKLMALNNTYNKFTNSQLNYLTCKYSEQLNTYIQRRLVDEASKVKEITDAINNLEIKDLSTLDNESLYNYLLELEKINKNINSVVKGTINSSAIEKFNSLLNDTIDKYVTTYEQLAKNIVIETKNLQYHYKSIKELNEYYNKHENFYDTYCDSLNSSSIASYLAKYSSFTTNMYKVSYFLNYTSKGFKTAAVFACENEIDNILNNNYDEETLASKLNDLKALFNQVNVDNIKNYNDIVPLLEKYA